VTYLEDEKNNEGAEKRKEKVDNSRTIPSSEVNGARAGPRNPFINKIYVALGHQRKDAGNHVRRKYAPGNVSFRRDWCKKGPE